MATDVKNHATLPTNLISYYELEEASGTRVDATTTGNDLTDNNTVGQATGIQGDAADFVKANTEALSTSTLWKSAYQTMSFSVWVNVNDHTVTEQTIWSNGNETSAGNGYALLISGQSKTDGTISFLNHNVAWHHSTDKITDSNWHHIVVTIDSSGDATVYLDDGTGVTLTGATTQAATNGSGLGAHELTSRLFDGQIDEMAIWDKVLTSTEITALYNSGSGIPYDAGTTFVPKITIF